jgi:hypothetical protein
VILQNEHQIPTPDTVDFSQVPREAQEGFYESWRIQEWVGTTSKILNWMLQPGFAKFGKGFSLSCLSFDIAMGAEYDVYVMTVRVTNKHCYICFVISNIPKTIYLILSKYYNCLFLFSILTKQLNPR